MVNNIIFKFKICLIFIFFLWPISSAQDFLISKDEAWQIVKEKILLNKLQNVNVYCEKSITEGNSVIKSIFTKVESPNFPSWFFFIDDEPLANWGHPCRYIYINIHSGEFEIENNILPPDLTNLETLIEYKSLTRGDLFNFKTNKKSLLNVCSSNNEYAVIISGGGDADNNYERYWNDCAAIYSALVNIYGYYDDHIYVLMSDGTSSGNDRHLIGGGYDSSPLDLDGDGDNDINYSATRANITAVFNTLGSLLNSNHNLFIFTTDHGARTSGYDAYMYLWYQTITDDQFAIEVAKVNAGRITIMMEQCYSGGFIDDLSGNNRVIATACAYNEPSYARTDLTYDEFAYHWISAVAGETPGGTPVDADDDNDGFVSMWEAYYFAKNHDTKNEHPQYNSSPSDMGKQLSLRGKIPYISGTNIVCTSNSTFTLNNIPPGVSLSWNVYAPNRVTPYSGTGSTATFHATCYSIGNCNLYFTISSAECGTIQVSKSLIAGGPDPYDVELDVLYSTGQRAPKSAVWLLCPNTTYHIYLMNSSSCSTSNYIWTIPSAWTKFYQYNNMISINTNSQPGGQIMVDATTCCTGCGSKRILIDYVGQYWDCGGGYFMASPNPADDYLDIDINKEKMTADGISIGNENVVTMVDKMGMVKYTDEFKEFPYRINTKNLPEGLYIINLVHDGKISSIKVIIEH